MNIAETLANLNADRTSEYDTQATVVRTEEGMAWVNIKGGNPETPCQMTIDCKAGDIVKIHVGNGRAWIVGNLTAPPTNDKKTRERLNELEIDHAIFKKSITVDNIIGTSGWINLGNGTFNYGNQLVWDGKQLVIQGDAKFTGKLEGATGNFEGELTATKLAVKEDTVCVSGDIIRTNFVTNSYVTNGMQYIEATLGVTLANANITSGAYINIGHAHAEDGSVIKDNINLYAEDYIGFMADIVHFDTSKVELYGEVIGSGPWSVDGKLTVSSSISTSGGNVIVNNTSAEAQIQVNGTAGQIYLYSQKTETGNRGLYGKNADGTSHSIISVSSSNSCTFNGHASSDLALTGGTVTGTLNTTGSLMIKNGAYAVNCNFRPSADSTSNCNLGTSDYPWYNLYLKHCVYYTNPPSGSGTAVYISSSGAIVKYSSDRRLKNSISPVMDELLDPNRLYDLPIYQYKYNNDVMEVGDDLYDKLVIGIMADEVDKIYPRACAYDSEGVPTGWNGNVLLPAMLKLLQDQKTQLENQMSRIEKLEKQLQASA